MAAGVGQARRARRRGRARLGHVGGDAASSRSRSAAMVRRRRIAARRLFGRGAEAGDAGHVLGAAAAAALLPAAAVERREIEGHGIGDDQRARALGPAASCGPTASSSPAPNAPQVLERQLAGGLHRVAVQQRAGRRRSRRPRPRLEHAGLVVGQHDADQRRSPVRGAAAASSAARSTTPSASTGMRAASAARGQDRG